jgi:hypothetical protein
MQQWINSEISATLIWNSKSEYCVNSVTEWVFIDFEKWEGKSLLHGTQEPRSRVFSRIWRRDYRHPWPLDHTEIWVNGMV